MKATDKYALTMGREVLHLRAAKNNVQSALLALVRGGKYEEAKWAIDILLAIDGIWPAETVDGLGLQARQAIHSGCTKIAAIKTARAASGAPAMGLKEAKDLVEAYAAKHGVSWPGSVGPENQAGAATAEDKEPHFGDEDGWG